MVEQDRKVEFSSSLMVGQGQKETTQLFIQCLVLLVLFLCVYISYAISMLVDILVV